MRGSNADEAVLSREELDALLEEIPNISLAREGESGSAIHSAVDLELQRVNESFALEQGLMLSNRQQRGISFSLIGQREIEMSELAELMLPTDMAAAYQLMPKGFDGYLLLSRPLFFQLLSMSFGAGPTIKPTRPPTREYSKIERRFYSRSAKEMVGQLEVAWRGLAPINLVWNGLVSRSAVAECDEAVAILATFDVKGFGEACRVRVAIPAEPFSTRDGASPRKTTARSSVAGISVMDVPIRLRAQVGTADLSLADVAGLKAGSSIMLDSPSDGSLTVRIGDQDKFSGVAGSRGPKRAVQLGERLGVVE